MQLPENAFRELNEGERYEPIMSPEQVYPEVNVWSVSWGIVMAVLFSAAAAYLGLKVGQVFEAAIPIAIIAVGASTAAKRSKALGENVIIQSIGACSGAVVAGAIFTLPAIYILQTKYPDMTASFFKIFLSSALGGIIGILFLIPFRKYFVSDMHGKYPFPEATATTQVLVSGAKGGNQAKPLLISGLVGGLYDFIVATFGWWNENFTTRVVGLGQQLADQAKLVFKVNTGAAVLGLGYIIGLKYAFIRSEEHTSELQSRQYLVCRLLLEKKKTPTAPLPPCPAVSLYFHHWSSVCSHLLHGRAVVKCTQCLISLTSDYCTSCSSTLLHTTC